MYASSGSHVREKKKSVYDCGVCVSDCIKLPFNYKMDHVQSSDIAVVHSDNGEDLSEAMPPCNATTVPSKKACLTQTDSKNFLKTPVVAAVDGVVGFVDFVLASDRDLFGEPLSFFKQQCPTS